MASEKEMNKISNSTLFELLIKVENDSDLTDDEKRKFSKLIKSLVKQTI